MGENLVNHRLLRYTENIVIKLYAPVTLTTTYSRMCNNQISKEASLNYVRKSHKPRLLGYTEQQSIFTNQFLQISTQ